MSQHLTCLRQEETIPQIVQRVHYPKLILMPSRVYRLSPKTSVTYALLPALYTGVHKFTGPVILKVQWV